MCEGWSVCVSLFFFFKEKAADVMRVSDGSSDVCSSVLALSWHARVERYWARAPAWIRLIRRRWRGRVVETVDHAGVIVAVRDTGGLTHRYILMTIASAGIAILGLLPSSPAVVIGEIGRAHV